MKKVQLGIAVLLATSLVACDSAQRHELGLRFSELRAEFGRQADSFFVNQYCERAEYLEIRRRVDADSGRVTALSDAGVPQWENGDFEFFRWAYYDRARQGGCEAGALAVRAWCDRLASPVHGDRRAEAVQPQSVPLGAEGVCAVAAEMYANDAVTWAQYGRALMPYYRSSGQPWDDFLHDVLHRGAELDHPTSSTNYCVFLVASYGDDPNQDLPFQRAVDSCSSGWSQASIPLAAEYMGHILNFGVGRVPDLPLALEWYEAAQRGGQDVQAYIDDVERRLRPSRYSPPSASNTNSGPSGGQVAAGVTLGAICLAWKACRNFLGDAARQAAVDAAVDAITDRD